MKTLILHVCFALMFGSLIILATIMAFFLGIGYKIRDLYEFICKKLGWAYVSYLFVSISCLEMCRMLNEWRQTPIRL